MSIEKQNPASCQTAVRRRFIPISYAQWFDSVHNKTKAFTYMSNESLKYYYRWKVKITCKHQLTTEVFRCYQDRYVKEQCNT